MLRKAVTTCLLSVALVAPATGNEGLGETLEKHLTGKNVGRIVGAGVGALLGSQVGDGKGQLAAVAIGTLAGFWVGGEIGDRLAPSDQRGIARTTQTALETGEDQTWTNPDTGVTTRVKVNETGLEAPAMSVSRSVPPLEQMNAFYRATATSNVRAGPGTGHRIVGRILEGEHIVVVGKVLDADWLMVSDDGVGSGFVYAPLLEPAPVGSGDESALRIASRYASGNELAVPVASSERRCSRITQEVILPDGTRRAQDAKACQRADGAWEMMG